MDNIIPQNNIYGSDIGFITMIGILMNNPMEKWLVLIRKGTYEAAVG